MAKRQRDKTKTPKLQKDEQLEDLKQQHEEEEKVEEEEVKVEEEEAVAEEKKKKKKDKKRKKEIKLEEEEERNGEEKIGLERERKVDAAGITSSQPFEALPMSKHSMDAIKDMGFQYMTQVIKTIRNVIAAS